MSKVFRASIALFLGVVIFVGLPLIGWGIADFQGFIGHLARLSYVMLVIVLEAFMVIKFPGVGSNRAEGTKTGGLYQVLRHPRYLGIILFNVGIALIFHSWLALLLVTALTLVLLWRIHDEEAFLRQAFGTQ